MKNFIELVDDFLYKHFGYESNRTKVIKSFIKENKDLFEEYNNKTSTQEESVNDLGNMINQETKL